ncbi:MAG: histidinol-phosphate transaminase [Anaerolineae bacterium]|nr:histidinol-phosphate transaminase [Anaerolineae bacterium]
MTQPSAFERLVNPDLREPELYVPGLTRAEASRRYNIPPEQIVKLSSNENPLGSPPKATQAVQAMLNDLHSYPDSKAHALRQAIAENEGLSKDNVIFGSGSSEIMSFIIRAFSRPDDQVLSMDPSFSVYTELAKADGRESVQIRLSPPFELILKDVEAHLTDKTRVIFMTRPNNPTSRLIPLSLLEQIADLAQNAIVVSDEAYIEFADNYRSQTAAALINRKGNVMVTRTFSKAYGIPNLRIGYALGPANAIQYLFRVKPKWNVGEVAQRAAIAALSDKDHLALTLKTVSEGRDYLSREFNQITGLEVLPGAQGNFIMVKVSGVSMSAEGFTDALGAQGFIIRGDFLPDYVRISIGTMPENERLIAATKRVLTHAPA